MTGEKTQQSVGVASDLNDELDVLKKMLFCVLLSTVTITHAGSGSKPRECIYIETGIKVEEKIRNDGHINDCLVKNKKTYHVAWLRCKADFYCAEQIRQTELLKQLLWFLTPTMVIFGYAFREMVLSFKDI